MATIDMDTKTELITLGGGCFWCLEAVFEQVHGVLSVESGYANGLGQATNYEAVCGGQTGFAEVVQLRFDPQRITLRAVLEVFFSIHDPTSLNRQGADVGTQYRSGIYWHEPSQRELAEQVLAELQAALGGRVVTELQPLRVYQRAEDYHQHYFARHPDQGYCAFVIAPKLDKFQRTLSQYLKRG